MTLGILGGGQLGWMLGIAARRLGIDCVFLDRDSVPGKAVCGLYEVRPVQCRTWPFWPEVLRNERAWNRMKKNTPCPGMGKGQLFTVESIVERLVEQRESEGKPW